MIKENSFLGIYGIAMLLGSLPALVLGFHFRLFTVVGLGIGLIVVGFIFLFATFVAQTKTVQLRPIVHVWEHNGITRVMPSIDFELWHQMQERNKLAGIHNPYLRTDSEIKILFSDKPDNTHMYTGTMEQYERFVRGCQIRKSEMQITYYPVLDFQTAWELVYGKNSKPWED